MNPQHNNPAQSQRIPTVARVDGDTLIELVYDRDRRKTGLAVSRFNGLWNIEQEVKASTGEILIPYSSSNTLIVNESVLLPSGPSEFGFKDELVADIAAFLHRYVDLSPAFEQIAPYYVLLSWVHDVFNELPYLGFRGDYGTGKTRALVAIGSLCYRPFFASGASTVSPIFHILDAFGGTLILDEADLPYSDSKSELVKILNNGTMKGMPVLRTLQNRYKELNPYAFRVFGPKLVATREPFQDPALESRFITERTGMRPLRPDIPIHLPDALRKEALELRNRLLHFRFCEFFKIKVDPAVVVEGIEPRLNQMALSLLSVIDDPAARAAVRAIFRVRGAQVIADRQETDAAKVLAALIMAEKTATAADIPVGVVAEAFNALHGADVGHPVPNKWIGHVLRTRLHLATRKTRGVYVVPTSEKSRITALAARYGLSAEAR